MWDIMHAANAFYKGILRLILLRIIYIQATIAHLEELKRAELN